MQTNEYQRSYYQRPHVKEKKQRLALAYYYKHKQEQFNQHYKYMARRRKEDPEFAEKLRFYFRKYHKEKFHKFLKTKYRELRDELLEAYGHKCACCGVTEREFLALDHINGGGSKHIKRVGNNTKVYKEVRDAGYPKDLYRLLCHNCNFAMGRFGKCPHGNL